MLLWLWCRPAATAPIRPQAWELPCAEGETLQRQKERQKDKKKTKKQKKQKKNTLRIYRILFII